MLEYYQGGVEMIRRDLLTGHWRPYLERATSLKPSYDGGVNGGQVAARILQDTANGKNYASDKLSGARRLRDAIVLGYQLQRVPGRDISILEWYASDENELGLRTGSQSVDSNNYNLLKNSDVGDFDILHGDVMGLPGGTICVIGRNCLRNPSNSAEYRNATGYMPFLVEGSSPGQESSVI